MKIMDGYDGVAQYFPKKIYVENMIHHAHCANFILKYDPEEILVVGPGDHTVVDCLRRRGLSVETLDIDENLKPTYVSDIKDLSHLGKRFKFISANEVLEHSKIEDVPNILEQLRGILDDNGYLYISVPYSTVRLFPKKLREGGLICGAGRFNTRLPLYVWHDILTPIRKMVRLFTGKTGEIRYIEDYHRDRFDVHHWDSGYRPTTRAYVRRIFEKNFQIIEETIVRYNMAHAADTWNVVMKAK